MTALTPDTATVRGRYCDGTYLQTGHTTDGADFDRWLAEHDREVATGQETRQVDLDETTDDDLGEYPALRCAVYGSAAASHWDDCERPADPLDESDHRPRHFPDGEHLYRNGCGRWHTWTSRQCYTPHDDTHTLAWWDEPLTFCDCPDDAIIEAENGATD